MLALARVPLRSLLKRVPMARWMYHKVVLPMLPAPISRDAPYLALLGRHAHGPKAHGLRSDWVEVAVQIMQSAEFALGPVNKRLDECGWRPGYGMRHHRLEGLAKRFAVKDLRPQKGFVTDFLGVRTDVRFISGLEYHDGGVTAPPPAAQAIFFEPGELEATLEAVEEAKGRGALTVMELGAGWGPWLVTAGAAARRIGIPKIRAIGVEADVGHFGFMRRHFINNGFDPNAHDLFNGAIGPEDGVARFPIIKAEDDWGAQAVFGGEEAREYRGFDYDFREVPCRGLTKLLEREGVVDLIHCDIQGGEIDVIPSAIDALTQTTRRVVVGTHSRAAEGALVDAFMSRGWELRHETPCSFAVVDGRAVTYVDGLQVWLNPKRAPA